MWHIPCAWCHLSFLTSAAMQLLRLRWHSDQRQWEALYSNTETEKFYKVRMCACSACVWCACLE